MFLFFIVVFLSLKPVEVGQNAHKKFDKSIILNIVICDFIIKKEFSSRQHVIHTKKQTI